MILCFSACSLLFHIPYFDEGNNISFDLLIWSYKNKLPTSQTLCFKKDVHTYPKKRLLEIPGSNQKIIHGRGVNIFWNNTMLFANNAVKVSIFMM